MYFEIMKSDVNDDDHDEKDGHKKKKMKKYSITTSFSEKAIESQDYLNYILLRGISISDAFRITSIKGEGILKP